LHACVASDSHLIDSIHRRYVEAGMSFREPDDGGMLVRARDSCSMVGGERGDGLSDGVLDVSNDASRASIRIARGVSERGSGRGHQLVTSMCAFHPS
jgi:hypothetical protein